MNTVWALLMFPKLIKNDTYSHICLHDISVYKSLSTEISSHPNKDKYSHLPFVQSVQVVTRCDQNILAILDANNILD